MYASAMTVLHALLVCTHVHILSEKDFLCSCAEGVAVVSTECVSRRSTARLPMVNHCHTGMEDCRPFVCSHIWQGLDMLDLAGVSNTRLHSSF